MKKNYKKVMSLILCMMLVVATCLTTGCSKKDSANETTSTPAATATVAPETTDAPTEEITTAPEVTDAPAEETTEEPEVTEAPAEEITEEPEVTEAPADEITEEPEVTEAPAEEITEEPEVTEAPAEEITGESDGTEEEIGTSEVIIVGEGATAFTFVCIDAEKNTTVFVVNTDQTTVGAALLELGLIAGEDSAYGLYVKEVNGIVADWDIDGTYWAFYIDGEYAMTGVDSTEITAGSEYTFVVE